MSAINQKQLAKRLILGGLLFIAFVLFFLSRNVIRIPSFAELLPAANTAALIEFPADLNNAPFLKTYLDDTLKLNWETIIPWAGDSAAIAILKKDDSSAVIPVLFLRVQSVERAFEFARSFRNPSHQFNKFQYKNITAFSTQAIHFVFLSDNLVIAPTANALRQILDSQTPFTHTLNQDDDFETGRDKTAGAFRLFIKPALLNSSSLEPLLKSFLPQAARLMPTYRSATVGAYKTKDNLWRGSAYAMHPARLPEFEKKPYRAALLNIMPQDADFIITGQNAARHLEQIAFLEKNGSDPQKSAPIQTLIKKYSGTFLNDLDLLALSSLITGEFAFSQKANQILFMTEIENGLSESIPALRDGFTRSAANRTPSSRKVTLPDGSEAFELIPNEKGVQVSSQEFEGFTIHGIEYGTNNRWYDATTGAYWLVSNNLISLQQSLQKIKQVSGNFMEGDNYKEYLQPVLKNPDFVGFGHDENMTIGLSKRTFPDHMEAEFMIEFTGVTDSPDALP